MDLELIKEFDLAGLFDIVFMSSIILILLVWLKRRKAAFILTGIIIIAGVYLLARHFNLVLTAALFENFFGIIIIALVIIFQEDLRYLFEQVAIWSLNRSLFRKRGMMLSRREVQILARTLNDLASNKTGALVVLRGRDSIARHLQGGVNLNGELSEQLLHSIFDSHSIGHDGAVIVEGNQVTEFSCHLPLSKNLKLVGRGGTRHSAALGLSELSDALCVAVSEERGTITVARHGKFETISDPDKLVVLLERFYLEIHPPASKNSLFLFAQKNWRELLLSLGLSISLWFVLEHGSKIASHSFSVPVTYQMPAGDWDVESVKPEIITASFRGIQKNFYFLGPEKIQLSFKLEGIESEQVFRVASENLIYPPELSLESLKPKVVKITIKKQATENDQK